MRRCSLRRRVSGFGWGTSAAEGSTRTGERSHRADLFEVDPLDGVMRRDTGSGIVRLFYISMATKQAGPLGAGAHGAPAHPGHHAHVLGGAAKTTPAPAVRISFARMWAGYPSSHPYVDPKTGDDPPGFDNQCAIKLSVALHATGVDLASFKGATVRVHEGRVAIRAEELLGWLRMQHFDGMLGAVDITGADCRTRSRASTASCRSRTTGRVPARRRRRGITSIFGTRTR